MLSRKQQRAARRRRVLKLGGMFGGGAVLLIGAGLFLLGSHSTADGPTGPDDVRKLVRFATHMFDYVILDTPGAFNDIVGAAIDVATQVVVVTSVDMASIKDTSFILEPVVLSKPRSRAATNLTALALKITGTATPQGTAVAEPRGPAEKVLVRSSV